MHFDYVLYLLLILLIQKNSFMEIIQLNDDTPLNFKLFDLKKLIPQTKMTYHLMKSSKARSYFTIKNDYLFTNTMVDMDSMCNKVGECCNKAKDICDFEISIACRENQESELIIKIIKISIRDKNDNYPVFNERNIEIEMSESVKIGYTITLPVATDKDFGNNQVETYRISRQEPRTFDNHFRLNILNTQNSVTVELKVFKPLDRETTNKYSFDLMAIDGGHMEPKTGSINIVIKVIDENDNMPQFSSPIYKESVKEGINSMRILRLSATDPDEGLNGKILYKFNPHYKTGEVILDHFSLNEDSGEIYLKKPLDYEKQKLFKFPVIAVNPTPPVSKNLLTSTAYVEISVEDVYDEPLEINVDYLNNKNFSIVEENKNHFIVAIVTVTSKETDLFRSIQCRLEQYEEVLSLIPKGDESYKSKSFEIRTNQEIDREKIPKISTKILCKESVDSHVPSSSAKIEIVIKDQNDNAPTLSYFGTPSILENTKPGTVVLKIVAQDKDEGENGRVTFSMEKSVFQSLEYLSIGETDGVIKVKSLIDCESTLGQLSSLSIVVTATDHGVKPKSTDLPITITVKDVNDNIPKFTSYPMTFTIMENNMKNAFVGEIEVEDKDFNDDINLVLRSKNPALLPFTILKKTNRIFHLNTTRSLDREKDPKFNFQVIATDSLGSPTNTVTGTVEVEVIDQNDNLPIIIFPSQNNATVHVISYLEPKFYKFMTVSANDQDQTSEYNTIEYQLESESDIFDIDRQDGTISIRREMTKSDIGEHILKIIVFNPGYNSMKSSVQVNVVIDMSNPKNIAPRSENDNNNNSGLMVHNSFSSSEIIIAILMVIVFFVVFVIIIITCVVLRHCHKEPVCLRSLMDKCFHNNLSQNENQVYSPTMKMNAKTDMDYYKDQLQNSSIAREQSNNWNHLTQSGIYNVPGNQNQIFKGHYTKLLNPSHYYAHPMAYQTIDDNVMNKFPDNTVNKSVFNMNNRLNCKSEMNLNTENLFNETNQELSQINEPSKYHWVSSMTPMQTRSKSVVNRVISIEQPVENNFAVVYPPEQSTFV